jgi:hypothetical protein
MKFNPNVDEETYHRLGALVGDIDEIIIKHIRENGDKKGIGDAFNAVCAVLAGVTQSVANFDTEVYDKLSGALQHHIFSHAASIDERGEYTINE